MPYVHGSYTSEYSGSKPSGQIAVTQEVTTPSYLENKHIVRAKEVRGGHHTVKYKGLLAEGTLYDGIMTSRREKGMLVYVELFDDDSPCDKFYWLKNAPGTTYANIDTDWQVLETPGNVSITGTQTVVADITERDALSPTDGDVAHVQDASADPDVVSGGRSYIYDGTGTQWLRILTPEGVNPVDVASNTAARHNQNTDTQLLDQSQSPVTGEEIRQHLDNQNKHFEINDANPTGDTGEVYSSTKVLVLTADAEQNAKDYTYSQADIDSKLVATSFGIKHVAATLTIRNTINSANTNELCLVEEDRKVYEFIGVLGQSGNSFWQFKFNIDVVIASASAQWNSPRDNFAVSEKAIADYVTSKIRARGNQPITGSIIIPITAHDYFYKYTTGNTNWGVSLNNAVDYPDNFFCHVAKIDNGTGKITLSVPGANTLIVPPGYTSEISEQGQCLQIYKIDNTTWGILPIAPEVNKANAPISATTDDILESKYSPTIIVTSQTSVANFIANDGQVSIIKKGDMLRVNSTPYTYFTLIGPSSNSSLYIQLVPQIDWANLTSKPNVEVTDNKGQANGYAELDGTGKVPAAQSQVESVNTRTGAITLDKTDVGLSNVTNEAQVPLTQRAAANGVATLDANSKIPTSQIPDLALNTTVVSAQATLADYISTDWVDGDVQPGDLVIINGATPKLFYMVVSNNGSLVGDYVLSTPTQIDWSNILNKVSATTAQEGIVQLNDTLISTSTTLAATANAAKQLDDKKAEKLVVAGSYTNLGDGASAINLGTDIPCRKVLKYTLDQAVTTAVTFSNGVEGVDYLIKINTGNNGYTFAGFNDTNIKVKDGVPLLLPDNGGEHFYYVEYDGTNYWVSAIYEEI